MPEPLHRLAVLVRHRPTCLHLVLATGSDPSPPLARLRLANQLRGVPARPDRIRMIEEQTDGWAAGLRLGVRSLRETGDLGDFLTDLVGNGKAISDYLVGEILSRFPAEAVEVLLRVVVCDRLTARRPWRCRVWWMRATSWPTWSAASRWW